MQKTHHFASFHKFVTENKLLAKIDTLCYADDLRLISLSSSGMQQLLHICNTYVAEHQLLHNGSKSFYLCFKRKN